LKWVCCKNCKLPEITHQVKKKALVGVCRACGTTDSSMDTLHKAGKQLHKDIPTYYQANPEFGPAKEIGPSVAATHTDAADIGAKPKKGKKRRGAAAAAAEEANNEEEEKK